MLTTFLIGLIPIHMLFINNIKEISLKEYLQTCGITAVLLAIIYLIFTSLIPNDSAGILTLIFWYSLYTFRKNGLRFYTPFQFSRKHIRNSFFIAYHLCTLFVIVLTYQATKIINLALVNKILFYTSLILTSFIALAIISACNKDKEAKIKALNDIKRQAALNLSDNSIEINNNLPDIYHFILDAHPGFNNPEFSDENFKQELLKRNFRIFTNHYSNYDYTTQSIPSLLQMKYFKTDDEVEDVEANNSYIKWSLVSNRLFKFLLSKSYKLNITYPELIFGINTTLSSNTKLFSYISSTKYKLLNMIKFKLGLKFKSPFYFINSPNEILYEFDKITEFKRDKYPAYNFVHILAPHAPNWFDENENIDKSGTAETLSYIKFCNKKVLTAIDKILSKNDNTIIVLHSDHGIAENEYRYRVLSTIYLPEKYSNIYIPEKITLVNLFRYIINGIFDEKLEILENKFFHMDWPNSAKITSIENQFEEFGKQYYKTK